MLVECGFTRVMLGDGSEWTFTPSFARITALGDPFEIVRIFGALHGDGAPQAAAYVLAVLCDQEDATPLTGWHELPTEQKGPLTWHPGAMPDSEMVIIARHLMQHGICGQSRPAPDGDEQRDGKFSDRFDAAEFVAAARVHLGMSAADAEALSMTEFQRLLDQKFPDRNRKRDVPNRTEYEQGMAAILAARAAKEAAEHG